MSSCAASCCTCFPRASFVSATSVSSLTADAPRYCRCASQHWAQFQYRSNRKPPLRNRTLFGVAPSVVDLWRSSNDLPLINSNSVLHHCWSLLQHETARPQRFRVSLKRFAHQQTASQSKSGSPRNLRTVHRVPPPSALLLPRSLLRALDHTVFEYRFSLPHPRAPSPLLLCSLLPTPTPLPRSIQFA